MLTVLTSSFVSGAIFYWLTGRKERREFLRDKLEALFIAHQALGKLIASTVYLPFVGVMAGNIDYNQALDLINSTAKDERRHYEICEMVIRLYFDEFLPMWDELLKRLANLNSVQAEFRRSYLDHQDTRRFIKPFDAAMREFEKQEETLRASIISKARKLTPPNRI